MAKKEKIEISIGDFQITNEEKFNRAVYGTAGRLGQLTGGVGEGASDLAKLAEYDRLGGLILKDGEKIATGSFFDFETKQPRPEPKITFTAEVDGEIVEVDETEVKAIKSAKKKVAVIKGKKRKLV